jgi:hypothetical protein
MPEGIFYVRDVDPSFKPVSGKPDRMRLGVKLTAVDGSINEKWFGHFGTPQELVEAQKKYGEAKDHGLAVHLEYSQSSGYYNVKEVITYDYQGDLPEVNEEYVPSDTGMVDFEKYAETEIDKFTVPVAKAYKKVMRDLFGDIELDGADRRSITAWAIHLRMDNIKGRKY